MILRTNLQFSGSICVDGIYHFIYEYNGALYLVNSINGSITAANQGNEIIPNIVRKSVDLLDERLRIGFIRLKPTNEAGTDQENKSFIPNIPKKGDFNV